MKIFFQKNDSLYKIFKTLEKIQNNKSIEIYIDPEHSFFDNEWWGKQIKELLEEKNIKAYFITKNDRSKYFFQTLGLSIIHQEKSKIIKTLNVIYLFFFNFKKFHLLSYNKKNYIFYVVFGFEVAFVIAIFYILYILILPSGNIYITPSQHSETIIYNFRYYNPQDQEQTKDYRFLSLPIYSGTIQYKYELSISSSNIKYIQNPSRGEVRLINRTDRNYSFVPNTRFVTDDGLLFQTTTWTELPAGSEQQPSEITVRLRAMEKDENGIFMGSRGNIPAGTRLYIKNLNQSLFLKKIYADVLQDMTGGFIDSKGTITQNDISILSGRLLDYMNKNRKEIVSTNFKIKNAILIPFNETISVNNHQIQIHNQDGEESATIEGNIISTINFSYILREDLINGFSQFISQRPSEKSQFIRIDKNSLVFLDDIKKEAGMLVIPTKIGIIQGYNFSKDINGILEDLKKRVVSKNKEEVQKIILSYPEIASTRIRVRPPRYNTLPQLKSRIKFIFE